MKNVKERINLISKINLKPRQVIIQDGLSVKRGSKLYFTYFQLDMCLDLVYGIKGLRAMDLHVYDVGLLESLNN